MRLTESFMISVLSPLVISNNQRAQCYRILALFPVFIAPCYLAVARHLSLPMVGVSALRDWLSKSIGIPQATAFVPNVFSGYSQGMDFWERLVNTVEHAVYSMQLNYYTECQNEFVRKHVDPAIPDVRQLYGDLALLVVNSHHSMQRIRALAPAVVEVAGLHLNDEAGKLDSIASFPRDKLDALYEAFRRIAPVRVLMKIANEKELPPGYSQLRVLRHKNVKAFMSHGGIFGIQEAICSTVPLIGIPLFGDQQANVDTFARTKVLYPLSFSDITADNVERAIRTVLEDPSYSDGIEKLRTLFLDRPMKPLDTAIFWIEYVARHGNVMRSPGLHIAWWQRESLDVYVFLGSSCALVLYTSLVLSVRKPLRYYRHYLGQGARHGAADSLGYNDERQKSQENKLDEAGNDSTLLPKPRNGNCEPTIRK